MKFMKIIEMDKSKIKKSKEIGEIYLNLNYISMIILGDDTTHYTIRMADGYEEIIIDENDYKRIKEAIETNN